MADQARKVARTAEERLDRAAETVREKFDRITESRFTGQPGRDVERRDTERRDTEDRKQPGERGDPPS